MPASRLTQTVLGFVFLATLLGVVLASTKFPALLLLMAPAINFLLNILWMGAALGMIIYGISRSKPGLAIAPILFAALWLAASVADRWRLATSLDPKVWDAPTSSDARAQRTLIMDVYQSVTRKIIADGHID